MENAATTYKRLLYSVAFLILALITSGCASIAELSPQDDDPTNGPEEQSENGKIDPINADLSPRNGQPTFIGIAERLHNRDEEEDQAIRHVAEQASRYVEMTTRFQIVMVDDGHTVDSTENIQTAWSRERADSLEDSVEVIDSYQDQTGTYVIATVDDAPSVPDVDLDWETEDDTPEWVHHPPQIAGFDVAVGVTRRYRRLEDSINFADQAALEELLINTGGTIQAQHDSIDISGTGTLEETRAIQEATATVDSFLVVARHATEDGTHVYSLVISQSV